MFEEDWLMRHISVFIRTLARILFNKDAPDYVIDEENTNSDTDLLYSKLTELIGEGKINEAENLLFDNIDPENRRYLELAIDFYSRLNALSDESLEKSGFEREEIDEGLKNATEIFGIDIF